MYLYDLRSRNLYCTTETKIALFFFASLVGICISQKKKKKKKKKRGANHQP